ncbi:MAG: EamA family transporter RarD, partial [Treponema sp.]|nr:EamA family transporter RarD [Treponema sp.]
MNKSFGKGVFFAALSYVLWGIFPLYWKLLADIQPLHILGFRIVLSLLLVSVILFVRKNFTWLGFFRDRKTGILMALAAVTISVNWGLYIWAINMGHTIEASLGYYINPLVSIALGLLFFREKLKPLQWLAFAFAAAGVAILTVFSGTLPWISLGLALTFGFYGLLKKTVSLSALESLGVETLLALPLGVLLFFVPFEAGGISYLARLPVHVLLLLLLSGAVTTVPLYLFAKGAKMLPLSTIGFIQFISPTLNFFEGYFIFRESFPVQNFIVFGFIWFAAILYIISLKV